jgi:CHAD domain-containing protein
LLQCRLRDASYQSIKGQLRDVASRLGVARDSRVLETTLAEILEGCGEQQIRQGSELFVATLKLNTTARLRELQDLGVHESLLKLGQLAREVRAIGSDPSTGEAIEAGVRKRYKKARKALERVHDKPSTARLHALRKQTKYLEYQVRELTGTGHTELGLDGEVYWKKISNYLGEDHDLSLLNAWVERAAGRELRPRARAALKGAIDGRRRRLQEKALRRADKVYRKKASSITGT